MRPLITAVGLLLGWEALVWATGVPSYILPPPSRVLAVLGAPLVQIRLPAALPAFASGARIAAAVAPIGAVIGEWVGASAGLGYLMTVSLARGQTPLAFAALVVLCLLGLALYYATDWAARRLVPWQPQGE